MQKFYSLAEINQVEDEDLKNFLTKLFTNAFKDLVNDINTLDLRNDMPGMAFIEIEKLSDFKELDNFDINRDILEIVEDENGDELINGYNSEPHIGFGLLVYIMSDDGAGYDMIINFKKGIDKSIINLIANNQEKYIMKGLDIPKENLI